MSFRLFDGQDHAKLYKKYREKPSDALILRLIAFLREKYSGPLDLAIDLGCGTGQCTYKLAKHFKKVLGTDISKAQIDEANEELTLSECKNVSFSVAPAEVIPMEDKKAQLITICTAAHWMDLPKVFDEGQRVLCPGGVLSIFCCDIPKFSYSRDVSKNDALAKFDMWSLDVLKEYIAEPVKVAADKYAGLVIPYSDFTREQIPSGESMWSLTGIIGMFETYSAFQTFCKAKGEAAGRELLNFVRNQYITITGIDEKDQDELVWISSPNYTLLMART